MSEQTFAKGQRVTLAEERRMQFIPTDAGIAEDGRYYGTVAAKPRANSMGVAIKWDGRDSIDRIPLVWLVKVSAE